MELRSLAPHLSTHVDCFRGELREEHTGFGLRVYYDASDVPEVIDEAREMFWRPYIGWRATLQVSPFPGAPRYKLQLRVWARLVYDGKDDDVTRLLAAFQAFLDEYRDHADQPHFKRRDHPATRQPKPHVSPTEHA